MNLADLRDLALHEAMSWLPVPACSAVGARLGLALGRDLYPEADAAARALMARLRSDLAADAAMLDAASIRLWRNIGRTFAEFSVLHRLLPEGRIAVADEAGFAAALGDGRPVITAFVHLGNWEALALRVAAQVPGRGCAVVEPPPQRARARIAARRRRHASSTLLTTGPLVWRGALRHLSTPGGVLWIAADESSRDQVMAPFFGRPARIDGNLGKIVRLAMRTGARVLPVHCERQDGGRFLVRWLEPVEFAPRAHPPEEEVLAAVNRLDARLAPLVRARVEDWYMAIEWGGPDWLDRPQPARSA